MLFRLNIEMTAILHFYNTFDLKMML